MSGLHDEEELPVLTDVAPLLIWGGEQVPPSAEESGWIPLFSFSVGPEEEGTWEGSWSLIAQRLQAIQAGATPIALECVHGMQIGRLRCQSVRNLLMQASAELKGVRAVLLERIAAKDAANRDGQWSEELLQCWGEWASVLPDQVTPVIALDAAEWTPAETLHLLSSALPSGVMVAFRGAPILLADHLEASWLGWDHVLPRGGICTEDVQFMAPQKVQSRAGLVIPSDRLRTFEDCAEIVHAIEECRSRGWSVRLIQEEDIHQAWHGLEALIILGDRITGKGRRQCAGFYAAGGSILWLRQPTGMIDEQEFATCLEFPVLE